MDAVKIMMAIVRTIDSYLKAIKIQVAREINRNPSFEPPVWYT